MKTYKNKIAVVTGAAAGIGQALARELARRGASLAINDVSDMSETLEELKQLGAPVYSEKTDMGNKDEVRSFRDNVLKHYGHIDVLINNAGIALGDRTFEELTIEDFEKITNINYWGVIWTTKLFYETLLSRPEGAIANISSTQGILSLPFVIPYCTTKFAVRGFTDTLRTEHKARGIKNLTVHTVHPGAVATNITINADYHGSNTEVFHNILQKAGASPTEAADKILNGILSNKGRIFISDGWAQDLLARLVPGESGDIISFLMKAGGIKSR